MVSFKMTSKIIAILLILFSTPCLAEERDRIRPYTDERGNTVYTNEQPPSQNNIPNNPNYPINPFNVGDGKDNSQKHPVFNPPASPQPLQNYNAIENNIFKSFARIVAFQFLMLITGFIFWLTALIDILRHEFTGSNKVIWFLTVTFIPILGPILYFTMSGRHKIVTDRVAPADNYTASDPVPNGRKHYTPPDI